MIFEKLREAALAFQLSHINTIYFGNGAYAYSVAASRVDTATRSDAAEPATEVTGSAR